VQRHAVLLIAPSRLRKQTICFVWSIVESRFVVQLFNCRRRRAFGAAYTHASMHLQRASCYSSDGRSLSTWTNAVENMHGLCVKTLSYRAVVRCASANMRGHVMIMRCLALAESRLGYPRWSGSEQWSGSGWRKTTEENWLQRQRDTKR